jgi:hypothetical protein
MNEKSNHEEIDERKVKKGEGIGADEMANYEKGIGRR